jgi:hypothetical protein
MNFWIELINGPIRPEILQVELLYKEVIVSVLFVIVYAVPIIFGIAWLLAALDCLFAKGRDMTQSQDQHKTVERCHGLSGSKFSQAAARLSQNDTGVAAGI